MEHRTLEHRAQEKTKEKFTNKLISTNLMNFLNSIRTILLALILSIGISYAYAAWAPPGAAQNPPPSGNIDAPVNVGDNKQYKAGNLVLNNSATPFVNGLIVWAGNVGIGVVSPTEKLDVNGNVKATAFLYSFELRNSPNPLNIPQSC